jgi:cell division ATPase FtsA
MISTSDYVQLASSLLDKADRLSDPEHQAGERAAAQVTATQAVAAAIERLAAAVESLHR